jgi:glycosyltransferase involved in cell wall biosynthesis
MNPGVSVIICCYNSEARLPRTLQHLADQKLSDDFNWEIIVVDNASTDQTKEVAAASWKSTGKRQERLKIVGQPVQGLSFARAKGVEASQFDIILFCDDDNWLDSNYVLNARNILQSDPTIGALGGVGTAVADVELPVWFEKYKGCYACYPQNDRDGEMKGSGAFLYGAGMVVRRECLSALSLKGFTPLLPDRIGTKLTSGGDAELSYAIRLTGYKLWYSSELKFSHYLPSVRLSIDYLHRLISSMSYCSGMLICYNYALEGKTMNRFVWIKDVSYQIMFFLRGLVRRWLTTSPIDGKLDIAFSYNRMLSIFHQAGSYRSRYSDIMKLKK